MCIRDRTYSAQLSLFEYKKPQLGAYLRFGPFFIGSDNILPCLLYTSDAADERSSVDLGGRRIIKKKNRLNDDGLPLITHT